jgi:hypothetical protein
VGTFPIYSKRNSRTGNSHDAYVYDDIPQELRVQIIHIWRSAIGQYYKNTYIKSSSNGIWDKIEEILCKEYGIFQLSDTGITSQQRCEFFLMNCDVEHALDIIEVAFVGIDAIIRQWGQYELNNSKISMSSDDAIEELNERFREHGIGYEFSNGRIMVINSELIHDDVVKPALKLLRDNNFEGAEDEFLKAHKHYREGNYKESVNEALKSFESTIKTISKLLGWDTPENAQAKDLIKSCFENNLLPSYLENHMNAVRTSLESGLPTVRNKTSGHGQGSEIKELPPILATYALNLAATNIVLLVESYKY